MLWRKINQGKMTATDKGRRHYPIWGGQGGLSSEVTSEQSPEWTYGERKTRTLCSMTQYRKESLQKN